MPDSMTIDDAFQQEDTIDIREYEETSVAIPLAEVSSLETPTERPQEIICYDPKEVFEEPIEVSCGGRYPSFTNRRPTLFSSPRP